jgi:hypothetical protein
MRAMTIAALVGLLALACAGCELFVDIPRGKLAETPCTTSDECAPPKPQCDLEASTCVECLADPDCTAERPVCDQHACRACSDDSECASAACLPDGSCAAESRVIYADPAATGTQCNRAQPCSLDAGLAVLGPGRDVVKLAAGTYERTATLAIGAPAILVGSSATLHSVGVPVVQANTEVTLYRLAIDAAGGTAATCAPTGKLRLSRVRINGGVTAPCDLAIDRSTIAGSAGYAVAATTGPVTITNTFLTRSAGGLALDAIASGVVEHVTIAANTSVMMTSGLHCANADGVVIRSDIIYSNAGTSIDAACNVVHSVVDTGYTGGTANTTADPTFVASALGDFHLVPGTKIAGTADPDSALTVDFDGEPRPQPAGTIADPGADEVP